MVSRTTKNYIVNKKKVYNYKADWLFANSLVSLEHQAGYD